MACAVAVAMTLAEVEGEIQPIHQGGTCSLSSITGTFFASGVSCLSQEMNLLLCRCFLTRVRPVGSVKLCFCCCRSSSLSSLDICIHPDTPYHHRQHHTHCIISNVLASRVIYRLEHLESSSLEEPLKQQNNTMSATGWQHGLCDGVCGGDSCGTCVSIPSLNRTRRLNLC